MNRISNFLKAPVISILWVILNFSLYMLLTYADKNSDSHLLFVGVRVVLTISDLMMILTGFGFIKFQKGN
jgi:hypothetical protein